MKFSYLCFPLYKYSNLFNYSRCNQAPIGFGVCEREIKRHRLHRSYLFFLIVKYAAPSSRKMCPRRSHISGNASRRAIPVEFSSEKHLRPRKMCIHVYVWHMHAACRRPPCNARTFLSVCLGMRMCMCVSLYAPNDDSSLFSPATQPGSGMRRDFTRHMRVMHEYSSVRIALYYRLSGCVSRERT